MLNGLSISYVVCTESTLALDCINKCMYRTCKLNIWELKCGFGISLTVDEGGYAYLLSSLCAKLS